MSNTPSEAIAEIEAILNHYPEETRVTICRYLLDISEQTLERL